VEVEVAGAADTTVVVVPPGSGDAMQASKAGLLEAADIFVVNKADRPSAAETRRDLEFILVDSIEQVLGVAFDGAGNGAARVMPVAVKQAARTR
jgi:putative protein kinase ArgK-like GTPase of G3E family